MMTLVIDFVRRGRELNSTLSAIVFYQKLLFPYRNARVCLWS